MSSLLSPTSPSASRICRGFPLLFVLGVLAASLHAQAPAAAADDPNANGNGRQRRNQNGNNGGGRGNFDPQQAQQQMMDRMREQFGVTDDAEWKLISERVSAVMELRRNAGGGFGGLGGFRGGQNNQGGGGRGGRQGQVSPEQDSLRQAITDNLPDAEIKSRLARLREVRKSNEEKLTKAQEDLRAVLSVRQEAFAVMAGLLP
jgi:hypothetical protein